MNNYPIGILDSGVGGLTIWREIIKLLPDESTIYIADSKNCPYGEKSNEAIYHLAKNLVIFLLDKKTKLIVIACNTITVTCLDRLRKDFPKIPIVGIVPVIKSAAEKTQTKRIGILSTSTTADSLYQKNLIKKFAFDMFVLNKGTNKLVPFIEKGDTNSQDFKDVLKEELLDFKIANIDELALGCSHFPLVKEQIQKILGKTVQVLDSGGAVSKQVRRILEKENFLSDLNQPSHQLFTTGNRSQFKQTIRALLGKPIANMVQ